MLRKTQSQPQPSKNFSLPSFGFGFKKKQDSQKHSRHQSVPSPVGELGHNKKDKSDVDRKTSCPSSPTGKEPPTKHKLENKKTAPAGLGSSSGGSPKPKRTIFEGFKHTLRPKSRSHDKASAAAASSSGSHSHSNHGNVHHGDSYANGHSDHAHEAEDSKGACARVEAANVVSPVS